MMEILHLHRFSVNKGRSAKEHSAKDHSVPGTVSFFPFSLFPDGFFGGLVCRGEKAA